MPISHKLGMRTFWRCATIPFSQAGSIRSELHLNLYNIFMCTDVASLWHSVQALVRLIVAGIREPLFLTVSSIPDLSWTDTESITKTEKNISGSRLTTVNIAGECFVTVQIVSLSFCVINPLFLLSVFLLCPHKCISPFCSYNIFIHMCTFMLFSAKHHRNDA